MHLQRKDVAHGRFDFALRVCGERGKVMFAYEVTCRAAHGIHIKGTSDMAAMTSKRWIDDFGIPDSIAIFFGVCGALRIEEGVAEGGFQDSHIGCEFIVESATQGVYGDIPIESEMSDLAAGVNACIGTTRAMDMDGRRVWERGRRAVSISSWTVRKPGCFCQP